MQVYQGVSCQVRSKSKQRHSIAVKHKELFTRGDRALYVFYFFYYLSFLNYHGAGATTAIADTSRAVFTIVLL